jgi:hypothetical protein
LCGCAHRYRAAVVAEGDLRMVQATSVFLFREGHSCYGQHGHHYHRSYHAKNRHITAHTNPTPLCGWALPVCVVGNIAGKGFLPVLWLTLARSSVTTGVPPRICRMAISWKTSGDSMVGNTRKLFRTSEPSMQQLWSYCPVIESTLQPSTSDVCLHPRYRARIFRRGSGNTTPLMSASH